MRGLCAYHPIAWGVLPFTSDTRLVKGRLYAGPHLVMGFTPRRKHGPLDLIVNPSPNAQT
jgi:hypothetical protein